MRWNSHFNIAGSHAFLAPSKYHWLNYDGDKLDAVFLNLRAAQKGSELHDIAAKLISFGIKLPRSTKTLNLYVNDAIGYKMSVEIPLFFSDNCFGTVDSISYRNNFLRIHDLKTGLSPTSMKQLEIYTALFCLEYHVEPKDLKIELRIYQTDGVIVHEPEIETIYYVMDKIKQFDERINFLKEREGI